MIQLHISGRLVRGPQGKTSSNGKPYIAGLVAVGAGDKEALVNLMVFDSNLQTLLASLKKNDSLSAMGSASISAYLDKTGTPQAGLTLMVNRLMAVTDRQSAPRPKAGHQSADRQQYRRTEEFMVPAGPREFAPDYADQVPF